MWLVAASAALVVAVMGHALLSRLRWVPGNMVVKFLAPGAVAGAILLIRSFALPGSSLIETLASLLAFALCCEVYIFLFTLVSSSISSRLLLLLQSGDLSIARIEALYPEEDMVNSRIDDLVRNGLLAQHSDRLVLTPRGEAVLSAFERLRRLFRHASTV